MTTTHYVWDVENDNYIAESDEMGVVKVEFTNEPVVYGDIISKRAGNVNQTGYFHSDGQSNVCQITTTSQELAFSASYDAFGEAFPLIEEGTESLLYKGTFGSLFDREINTYYVRTRSYSPLIGRWLAMDRLGFRSRDVNLFRFVFNSPTRYKDPSGLKVLIYLWEGAFGKDIDIGQYFSIPSISYSPIGDVYKRIASEVLGNDAEISYSHQKVLQLGSFLFDAAAINLSAKTKRDSDCKYCYDRIVLAGYSWGAHYATSVAAGMQHFDPKVTIDLVFTIDPVFSEGNKYTIGNTEHIDHLILNLPFTTEKIVPANFCKWPSFHQESDTSSINGFFAIRGDILDWSEDDHITRLQLNTDEYSSLPNSLKVIPIGERSKFGHMFVPYLSSIQQKWRNALINIKKAGALKRSFDDKTCRTC